MDELKTPPNNPEDTKASTPTQPKPPVVNDITPPPSASVTSDPVPVSIKVESSDQQETEQKTEAIEPVQDEDSPEFIETEAASDSSNTPAASNPDEQNESVKQPAITEDTEDTSQNENTPAKENGPSEMLAKPPEEEPTPEVKKPMQDDTTQAVETNGETVTKNSDSKNSTELQQPPVKAEEKPKSDQPAMEMGVSASQSQHRKDHPHRNNKTFAIVSVLFIALLLSGAAVYVYLSTDNNAQQAETLSAIDNRSTGENQSASKVDSGDIDELLSDIQQAVSSRESIDREALSDDSIGL